MTDTAIDQAMKSRRFGLRILLIALGLILFAIFAAGFICGIIVSKL